MELRFLLLVLVLLAPLLPGTTGDQQHAHLPATAAGGNTTTAPSRDPLRIVVRASGSGTGGGASPSATAAAAAGDDASTPPPPQLSRPNRDLPTVPSPLDHEPVPTPPSPDFFPDSALRTIPANAIAMSAILLLLLIAATH
uniref:Uncharacterized protein n=1 Tax=Oryza meridionalis TaxID=40149 RepID=A0A0E0F3N7_9ORYZ